MTKKCAMMICVVTVSVVFSGCEKVASLAESKEIKMVKAGRVQSCPNATLEQMVNGFMSSPKWESGTGEGGASFVNATGDMVVSEKEVRAKIQFLINKDKKGFEFNAMEFNEVPQNHLMVVALLEKMCESAVSKTKNSASTAAESPQVTTDASIDLRNIYAMETANNSGLVVTELKNTGKVGIKAFQGKWIITDDLNATIAEQRVRFTSDTPFLTPEGHKSSHVISPGETFCMINETVDGVEKVFAMYNKDCQMIHKHYQLDEKLEAYRIAKKSTFVVEKIVAQ